MRRSLQRLAMVVLLLLAVSMLTFVAMNVLGDPLFNILGPIAGDTENPESIAKIEAAEAQYYLDKPLPERYVRWLGDFVTGDMGVRFASDGQPPVSGLIKERLPRSLVLMGMAQVMALAIAIPWGVASAAGSLGGTPSGPRSWRFLTSFSLKAAVITAFAALLFGPTVTVGAVVWFVVLLSAHQRAATNPVAKRFVDLVKRLAQNFSSALSFGFISMPNFALAVFLYYVFALKLGLFPLRYDASDSFLTRMWQLLLPALTLALPGAAVYQRLLRTDLITTLQEDFILMARAKGVSKRRVLFRHALRPSMFSVVTVFGINAGALVGGALVVETFFGIPGIGTAVVEAILREDFPVVLAIVMIVAAGFVILNFLVDLLYSVLDPRVRS
ncbi:MAG: peptide/nickel transport system permease protein [Acidimicrobiales bacterium]|jgi:peptide/nickel transport system permease protein